ncbi:MFS transporter [Eremomyces bilateralis CBS 781.70]|uniref:MFS transporter n=1 Tax=Eremomyces bilateralis CBS 781.70 TaxID=1392243 RepID=A0A6G1GFX4_9PEZI|nr:MFS transporter [Eremomyces bilateralis CBS 781.70]KAF1816953.1 MFS transporter [Eremomyces bilateralis CBS 781.70]
MEEKVAPAAAAEGGPGQGTSSLSEIKSTLPSHHLDAEKKEHGDAEKEISEGSVTHRAVTDNQNSSANGIVQSGRGDAEKQDSDSRDPVNQTEDEDDPNREDTSRYVRGLPLILLTAGLCSATFMIALDNTIIATAIPAITTYFNSLPDVGWYGSSYLLTTTSLQPTFGKIYTYFDVKYTFITAIVIFEVGSVICAAARNSPMLIIGRAIAGVGAAAIFSGGMNIMAYSVALRHRAIYIATISAMFGISSVVGPILGGVLTDRASWRWCFWINLPIGGLAVAVVLFFFQNPKRQYLHMTVKEKIKKIDILGAVLLISAITCLLLALQWGGTTHPWKDSRVWGCLLGFGLIISCFIALQIYLGDEGTLPPRIIAKQRTVRSAALLSSFLAMGLYTHIYYLPFYFQAIKGTSAEDSGIRCISYLVSNTIASIIVGGAVTILGYYTPFLWVGTALFTIGSGLLFTLKVDSPAGIWIGYQILAGAGAGAAVQIPFIAVQVVLPLKDMPIGNATAIFFNSLGGAISISIAQNIFLNSLLKEVPRFAPGVDPRILFDVGATNVRQIVNSFAPQLLDQVLVAYNKAITTSYILPIATGGLAFLSSLMFEWKSIKGKSLIPGVAG